jgi:putative FmdB family regulatory protein
MPTYEYQCPSGHQFELFQSITSESSARCPVCAKKARRLMSGGMGLIFKGSGFYETDYKGKNKSTGTGKSQRDKDAAKETSTTTAGAATAESKSNGAVKPATTTASSEAKTS